MAMSSDEQSNPGAPDCADADHTPATDYVKVPQTAVPETHDAEVLHYPEYWIG
jgi:hypothetical protein